MPNRTPISRSDDGATADDGGTSTGTDGGVLRAGEPGGEGDTGGSGSDNAVPPVLMVIANQDFWIANDALSDMALF